MIYLENGKNDLFIPNKGDGVRLAQQPKGNYYTKEEIDEMMSHCCDVIDCGEY